ncbi:MAG: BTAD domain-containing putative transcriptional regulator [Nocardioides sp.]
MGISVLGPLTVEGSGGLSRRDRVVLGSLATNPGQPVSADQLADALWGDRPPASASKILQGCVVRIRKLLGRDAIQTSPQGYALLLPPDQVDSLRFEVQVSRARELLTFGEADRAAYLLTGALSLWHGDPFADLEDWEPARTAARRLSELRLDAEELRVDALLRAGRHREVLAETQALVRTAPLREHRWALLARAQYLSGQQGEALRTIHQLKGVLAEHLGIDPGPDVVALEQSILRPDESLLVADAREPSAVCPWQGLKPYGVDDADRFFGREEDVAACLEVLNEATVLALVGPSGSGKSSILRAGVAAALRRRGTPSMTVTPGAHPLRSLTVLDTAAPGAALLVDQCEELFSLCDDPAEQQEFLHALAAEAANRPVAVALRADRLADVAAHPGFSRLVERGLYLVGGLAEEGLRTAVETPARQSGLVIEPGLVDLLVSEVRNDPGALPLMSHALLETWKRREGNTLTVAGYRATGGINGAVAQSAEHLYSQVEAGRRHLLRDLMLRLVSPGPQGEPVRTRVPRRLVGTDPAHNQLIEMMVAARLVTSDDGALEITHEALARAWPRLRGWLDDDIEGQRIRHHLSAAADAWDTLDRPDSELYRGVRLARVLEWGSRRSTTLTRAERDFLDASRLAAWAEEQSAVDRARAQARLIRRLRVVLGGAAVLLVVALVAGGLAAVQSQRAGDSADAATASETQAVARRAGANALVTDDLAESMLLAVAGVRLDESFDTRNSLLAAIGRQPELLSSTPIPGGELPMLLDAGPDGRYVAVLAEDWHLRLYDARTGVLRAQRQLGPALSKFGLGVGRLLSFSPDGNWLAVSQTPANTTPVALLQVPGLERARLGGLPRSGWAASDLSFSADGTRLTAAIQRFDATDAGSTQSAARALVWDVADPASPTTFRLLPDGGQSVALDSRGRVLYTANPLTRHVVATGDSRPVAGAVAERYLWSLNVVARDREILAVDDSVVRRFDVRSGRQLATYLDSDFVNALRLSPDGRSLLATEWNTRHATEWRLSDPASPTRQLDLDRGNPGTVDYSADGTFLHATGQGGNALRRWDLTGHRQYLSHLPTSSGLSGGFGVVAPGGRHAVVLWEDQWDVTDYATGNTSTIRGADGFRHTYGAFHPNGKHYVTAISGEIRVWDMKTGRPTGLRASMPTDRISELDYTADGSRVAVAELSGQVTMLDGQTLRPVGRPADVGENVSWVVARPDGRTAVVLTGGVERTGTWILPSHGWAVVDLEAGRVVRRGQLQMSYGQWLAVSPDGRTAVVTGGNHADSSANSGAAGLLERVDLTTGRSLGPPRSWAGSARAQVSYSPDGRQLLTASPNGAVAMWNATTGAPVSSFTAPGANTLSGAFLPSGRSVRLLDWNTGIAYTWDPDIDHAVDFACRVAGRNFTREEWRTHFGDRRPYVRLCDL